MSSEHVGKHKKEVCFPGGMVDATDSSITETSLRELHEEVGIPPSHVDVLGGQKAALLVWQLCDTRASTAGGRGCVLVHEGSARCFPARRERRRRTERRGRRGG